MSKFNSKTLGKKLNKLGFTLVKRTDRMAGDYWLVQEQRLYGESFVNANLHKVNSLLLALEEKSKSSTECTVDYNPDTEQWECLYLEDSRKQSLNELTAISQDYGLYE